MSEAFRRALIKLAEGLETNEDDTQMGVNNVRENPEGRAPGTLDALWGDDSEPGHAGYPDVYGSAVLREAHDGRGAMLDRLFDSVHATAPAEQALMRQHFGPVADESLPHSPLLQHGRHKTAAPETLTDLVMRIAGRR